jgi:pyrroloquinoline-quinone synthase
VILENLNDEEGVTHGKSHPELWLQFAEAMGAERQATQTAQGREAIQNVVSTFFRLAHSSFPEGLGALYAYEHQVPEIAESKITGLKERYDVHSPNALAFFEVHRQADVEHRAALEQLLDGLSVKEQALALKAAREAATALWNFLSDVHTRNPDAVA